MKCKNMDNIGNCCLTIGHISCTCRSRNERITALRKAELAATDIQQLKAEIAAMLLKWKHCCELGQDWYEVESTDFEKLRQLSTV